MGARRQGSGHQSRLVIKPFGWHVQFHLDARDLVELAPRLEKLPVEIVIDHLGHMPLAAGITHPGFQVLLRWLREKRCWVKLSAPMRFEDPLPPYPSVAPFAEALIAAGPDRVVWGSDWPHVVFDGHMRGVSPHFVSYSYPGHGLGAPRKRA